MLKIKATENGVNKVFPAVGQKIKVGEIKENVAIKLIATSILNIRGKNV